jgi:anti-sigma factor RsiW
MSDCKLFDKYRDREMSAAGRSDFESHLAVCENCRAKMFLLNNVVHVLKQDTVQPVDLSERIAKQAFQQSRSWDALVLSWLRPGQALAALALVLVFIAFMWFVPGNGQTNFFTEYEALMEDADAVLPGTSLSQTNTDSEFVMWLEQEGNLQ